MKKYFLYLTLIGVVVMSFSSCTIQQKVTPVAPLNAQVNFDMNDLEYIGEVSGTNEQSYVLGFIPYGGRKYHIGQAIPQGLGIALPGNRGYNNALYDALSQRPDADFVLPVSYEVTRHQQFLGNRQVLTVRCKAFKLKS